MDSGEEYSLDHGLASFRSTAFNPHSGLTKAYAGEFPSLTFSTLSSSSVSDVDSVKEYSLDHGLASFRSTAVNPHSGPANECAGEFPSMTFSELFAAVDPVGHSIIPVRRLVDVSVCERSNDSAASTPVAASQKYEASTVSSPSLGPFSAFVHGNEKDKVLPELLQGLRKTNIQHEKNIQQLLFRNTYLMEEVSHLRHVNGQLLSICQRLEKDDIQR